MADSIRSESLLKFERLRPPQTLSELVLQCNLLFQAAHWFVLKRIRTAVDPMWADHIVMKADGACAIYDVEDGALAEALLSAFATVDLDAPLAALDRELRDLLERSRIDFELEDDALRVAVVSASANGVPEFGVWALARMGWANVGHMGDAELERRVAELRALREERTLRGGIGEVVGASGTAARL